FRRRLGCRSSAAPPRLPPSSPSRGKPMRTVVIVTLLLMACGTGAARAHAVLDHASARGGRPVATSPHEVSLSSTQNLEPAFSAVQVTDTKGARVDLGQPQI